MDEKVEVVEKKSEGSILTTIKKLLGISEEDESFDLDVMVSINTAISILSQLGVGPESGFHVTGKDELWEDYLGEDLTMFQEVKNDIYYRVRLIFDPPTSSSAVSAMENGINELEWRMTQKAEMLRRASKTTEVI